MEFEGVLFGREQGFLLLLVLELGFAEGFAEVGVVAAAVVEVGEVAQRGCGKRGGHDGGGGWHCVMYDRRERERGQVGVCVCEKRMEGVSEKREGMMKVFKG